MHVQDILYRGKFPWGKISVASPKINTGVNHINSLCSIFLNHENLYPTEIIFHTEIIFYTVHGNTVIIVQDQQ